MSRPGVKAYAHTWKTKDAAETPGIGLWGRRGLTAHLTYAEAYDLANRLVDLADRLEAKPKENQ